MIEASILVIVAFIVLLYGFALLLFAFTKGKCSAVETDEERRIRELNLPMRKKWQRSS